MLNSEKGVSELVVIVLFLLVLAGIGYLVYLWAAGFVSEKTSEASQASEFIDCSSVSFILRDCSYTPGYLKVQLESLAPQDLNGFTAHILYQNGLKATYSTSNVLSAKSINLIQFLTDHNLPPEEIILYPNACPSVRLSTTRCSYSNIASSTISMQEGSIGDTNSVVLDSNTIMLSQETISKTFTNTDFSNGTFYFTEVGSIEMIGELDYNGDSLPESLKMYLKMNSIGNNKISDASGNGNHAYIKGSASLASGLWTTNALYTDGNADNYLSVDDNTSLDIENSITVTAWIKPNNASQGTIIAKGNAYRIYIENGYIIGEVNGKIVKAQLPTQ